MQTVEQFLITIAVPSRLGVVIVEVNFFLVWVNVIAFVVMMPAKIQILHFVTHWRCAKMEKTNVRIAL